MTREIALLIIVAVAVLLVGAGIWAWRRRAHRDGALVAPAGEIPTDATVIATFAGFYVATTRNDEPLERLAIRGLGFRSRMTATITSAGVALDIPGQARLFLALDTLHAVDQATVAIDRVVERDGLVRLTWRIADERRSDEGAETTLVDTYLRPQDASTGALADAVRGILSTQTSTATSTSTGSDA